MRLNNTIKKRKILLTISFIFGVIALFGDIIILSEFLYEKIFFGFMIIIGIILYIYYMKELDIYNDAGIQNYNNYYYSRFVPIFITVAFIEVLIIFFTRSFYYSIISFVIIFVFLYFVYKKYIKN